MFTSNNKIVIGNCLFYPDYPELDQPSSCVSTSTSYMDITSESEQGNLSACNNTGLLV